MFVCLFVCFPQRTGEIYVSAVISTASNCPNSPVTVLGALYARTHIGLNSVQTRFYSLFDALFFTCLPLSFLGVGGEEVENLTAICTIWGSDTAHCII